MKILIVSATEAEIAPLIQSFIQQGFEQVAKDLFQYKGLSVEMLATGIGMVATAFRMGSAIGPDEYNLAINVGIAGSFNKTIPLGRAVSIYSDRIANFGADDGDGFIPADLMGIAKTEDFIFTENIYGYESVTGFLQKVNGITVNNVHGNWERIKITMDRHAADVESMEGAAFYYACNRMKLKCCQIRAISNYVEKRDREKWVVDIAIENLTKAVMKIIFTVDDLINVNQQA